MPERPNATVSLVVPVYNEERNILRLFQAADNVLRSLSEPYEIIFINDGSDDHTGELLGRIRRNNPCVIVISQEKNYGQLHALRMGFERACGDIVIVMDGDGQNDPRDIPRFLEKMSQGYDLVTGWRMCRCDTSARRHLSRIANWIIRKRTGIAFHDYGCAFTAVRKELLADMKKYGAKARFIKPLLAILAHSPAEIPVTHHPREQGASKYNMRKIILAGCDFVFHFPFHSRNKKRICRGN